MSSWNPAAIGANITLTNGNRTWTSSSGSNTAGLGTLGLVGGFGSSNSNFLAYFEASIVSVGAFSNSSIGIANQNQNVLTDFLGSGIGSAVGMGLGPNGAVHYLNTSVGTLFTYTTGALIGVAIDFLHQKMWWTKDGTTWNNDVIGNQNPATNTGGQSLSSGAPMSAAGPQYFTVYPAFGNANSGDSMTLNSLGPFSYTVPSGFRGWDALVENSSNFFFAA